MAELLSIQNKNDIPEQFRNTPIGDLLLFHNCGEPHRDYAQADLLVGMCMDNRKRLNIPEKFAFIIRTGGANLKFSDFHISYAIALGKLRHIVVIGHTQCGMVNLEARKEPFIKGLSECAGWSQEAAAEHFEEESGKFEIHNEIESALNETSRLSKAYPQITVTPLLYKVEDNQLYLIC